MRAVRVVATVLADGSHVAFVRLKQRKDALPAIEEQHRDCGQGRFRPRQPQPRRRRHRRRTRARGVAPEQGFMLGLFHSALDRVGLCELGEGMKNLSGERFFLPSPRPPPLLFQKLSRLSNPCSAVLRDVAELPLHHLFEKAM